METFTQGARKARATDALMRDENEVAQRIRKDRFKTVVVLLTLGVFAAAFLMLSTTSVAASLGARGGAVNALGRALRTGRQGGRARSGVLAGLGSSLEGGRSVMTRFGTPELKTPIFFISLGTADDDTQVKDSLERMRVRTGLAPETLKRLVTVSKGVDATAWPDNTHLVEYAVKDIRTLAAQHGNVLMPSCRGCKSSS